jgi:HEPN domain-containing protein
MESYEDLLREALPWIDQQFSKDGKAVSSRPLAAARIIVEHFLVEIKGDTKENYLTKLWFKGIYDPISRWYEARYGEDLTCSRYEQTRGLVLYFGVPLLFRMPLVIHDQPEPDGTTWLRFPKEVLAQERPLDWIDTPPPLTNMPAKRKNALEGTTRHIANALRAININLHTADLEEASFQAAMASSVLRHLEKAAIDAAAEDHSASSLAIWELQMACEKTMKTYLAQKGITFPQTHDLRVLQKLAVDSAGFDQTEVPMASIPTEKRVMAWRYLELEPPKPSEFYRCYVAALTLCRIYTNEMSRKYILAKFAVQLPRPPWRLIEG